MESRCLRALLLCVVVTTLLALSLGEVAAPRKSLEKFSENIVGGEDAAEGRYPYVCYIASLIAACTGTLVHPKIVITAAHCVSPYKQYAITCGGVKRQGIVSNKTYLGEFVQNPSYVDVRGFYDVAMIRLDGEYNDLPLPIVSRDKDQFKHGRPATAIGWGEIKENTGLTQDKLKIARDIIPTDLLCGYKEQTLCGTSLSGRVAHGDSGGPLVIEGTSKKKDVFFGITSAGLPPAEGVHVSSFTNVPYYLEDFISPYLRDIEKMKDAALPDPDCPTNPSLVAEGRVIAEQIGCNVTFVARNSTEEGRASVKWDNVVRSGAEVAFYIRIDHFEANDTTNPGFRLDVYEDISLYVMADGNKAMWKHNGKGLGYSLILPGSGLHKVRILNTVDGFEVYEDGLKAAIVDNTILSETVEARFDSVVESAGLSYTMSITSIRMTPASKELPIEPAKGVEIGSKEIETEAIQSEESQSKEGQLGESETEENQLEEPIVVS